MKMPTEFNKLSSYPYKNSEKINFGKISCPSETEIKEENENLKKITKQKYYCKEDLVSQNSSRRILDDSDREELSDLTESVEDLLPHSNEKNGNNLNRIVSYYEKVKLRKTSKRTGWQNTLTCGIMLIDKREYIVREAMRDLIWDEEKVQD